MIEVLHEISKDSRQEVMNSCFKILKKGGTLVIVDETYPTNIDEFRKDNFLFPVQTGFEELIWGNIIPDKIEQEALIKKAGFKNKINRFNLGEGFTVLSIQKQ